ncbi:MAG: hypothetical protein K0R90_1315 [Oscillospiraceae bacterium]|jgi:glyoxylase-like metal-dependent hydrolase (beta-lactamase superfamily II)|nr:hypothetical protein [Oscillospiraceae bacterium]
MRIWNKQEYKVYKTKTRRCTCYVIEFNATHILIDTSIKIERRAVERCIQTIGISRIDAIFLTHSHSDHVENAKYFSDIFHCPVYISANGLDRIRNGKCAMPKGTRPYSNFVYFLEQNIPFYDFTNFEPCPKIKTLDDAVVKFYLGEGAKLIDTPGHTDDSVSIIINHAIAIVGDAMVNVFGNQYPPFADDQEIVKIAWLKLLDTQCELFCPAHGKPLNRQELMIAYKKYL